jgi:hypothetical protein
MITKYFKKITIIALALFVFAPGFVLAHQPRINTQTETTVINPEISKAYYGQLTGNPHFYNIKAEVPFNLYVNILVPDIEGQKKDVSAAIVKNRNTEVPLAVLDGINFEWKKFWEPYGRNWYLQGPEYKAQAEAGEYIIVVWSSNNDSKYSLAIGETENFNATESISALNLIPQIKHNFFNESPINFILSPFGWGLILVMYLLAFAIGFIYKLLLRKFAKNPAHGATKNIGKKDRLIRALLGLILIVWAITTTWNPFLLFFSGFCFFEAIFSWCAVYSALGKNTCPI